LDHICDKLCLVVGELPIAATGLQQRHRVQFFVFGVKDVEKEIATAVLLDQKCFVHEGKARFITCGTDDQIDLLPAAVIEVNPRSIGKSDIGFDRDATVSDVGQIIRIDKWMRFEKMVIRYW